MIEEHKGAKPDGEECTDTHFAPADRSTGERLARETRQIAENPVVQALLGASGGLLAVLNKRRQVMALNQRLLEQLDVQNPGEALGLRLGEAVGCVHADDNPGGCGTGRMCSSCGAAVAIVTSLVEDTTVERICAIQIERDGQPDDLYLSVRAHPIEWEGDRWLLLFLQDVSTEQQGILLEKAFLHDFSNLVTALLHNASWLGKKATPALREEASSIERLARQLASQLSLQRIMIKAEAGEFVIAPVKTTTGAMMDELELLCAHQPAAEGRAVRLEDRTGGFEFETDPAVLSRVLANMLINALEATPTGGEVRAWCELHAGQLVFCVSNPGDLPVAVAGRLFQRNFSTKGGLGRGLGTHSMKVLGERVLGGEVDFGTSGAGETIFSFRLPNSAILEP